MADKAKLLVITGPTATGKTALSVLLAQRLNGEIICADSMQIYQGLVVGTAQPAAQEMQGVPHHLMGFLPPDKRFSVADYVAAAAHQIQEITARGHVPILVGGTGLYIESLVKGVSFAAQKTDFSLRDTLRRRLEDEGIGPLYAQLQALDPQYAAALHPNNHIRVLRALEFCLQTGGTMTQQLVQSLPAERPYRDCIVALAYPTREMLYERINVRVDEMLAGGILEEARMVYDHRDAYQTAAQAIGYKEFFDYFSGDASLDQCVEKLKQASRNYAKRQLTWFRRMESVHWLPAATQETAIEIETFFCAQHNHREG